MSWRLTANASTSNTYREEVLNGREYVVVPLTLIVPGVLDGSNGPILYEPEELAKDPEIWNGLPLIAYHPEMRTENGEVVAMSARDPDVLNESCIGYNYRTLYTDNALRSEGWFDKELTARYDERLPDQHKILPRLMNGVPVELSTGLFANNIPHKGQYNGIGYDHIARDYKTDHIAILPDQKGACSVKDGCGTGVSTQNTCRPNYRGMCMNCGGKGGKPGPCPKGGGGSDKGGTPIPAGPGLKKSSSWKHRESTKSKSSGKSNPTPKKSSSSPSKSASTATEPAQKATQPAKAKAFRNPAEANRASDAADKASTAANMRMPTPSKKEGGVGVVPHETAMKEYKEKQQDAAIAHEKAALAHQKLAASKHPNSARHSSISEHHHEMAKKYRQRMTASHNKSSNTNSKGIPMKEQLIKWLTVNCDCWKGKEKILNELKEEDLKEFKNQGVAKRITNAAAAGFKGAFTTNEDGEGEVAGIDYASLAEFFAIDVDPSKDPVGFTKQLKAKLQEVIDALGGPDTAPPSPSADDQTTMADPDDEPVKNALDDVGPAKDATRTTNRKKMTPAQFKEMMPEEMRHAWDRFVRNSRNERETLLKRIATGTTGKEREAIINAHKSMDLDTLTLIANRMNPKSANNNRGYLPEDNLPTFDGGSGYDTNHNSQFNEDDTFEVPVHNFTRNERFKPKKPNHLTSDFDTDDGSHQ